MDKRTWRTLLRERRDALTPEQRAAWAERMVDCFFSLPEVQALLPGAARPAAGGDAGGSAEEPGGDGVPYVLLYAAVGSEAPTQPLARRLLDAGVRVCLPRLERARPGEMEAVPVHRWEELVQGPFFGILQPPAATPAVPPRRLNMVVVPGVGFDRRGRRLGTGGGYYDRFLPRLSRRAVRVGWAFSLQVVDELPEEEHDCGVHFIVTEAGVVRPPDRRLQQARA